jgi:hypothetical protein
MGRKKGSRGQRWGIKTQDDLLGPKLKAQHDLSIRQITQAYDTIDAAYERVAAILDEAGISATSRIAYRAYAEECWKAASKFSSLSLENQIYSVYGKGLLYGLDDDTLIHISNLFGVIPSKIGLLTKIGGGALPGDMLKSVYDIDLDGIVDNSELLSALTVAQVQDHDPKAHTLASHSTKAHSELSDVTADQHHAQSHTLASHSTKAHSELSDVTANQHHAQAHGASDHDATSYDTLAKLLAENIRPTINRVAGILPTSTVFDTAPTNLANITDGDWTNETGEGIKSLAGKSGDIGDIFFDMGADYPVVIIGAVNGHRVSGDGMIGLQIAQSFDNSTWGFGNTVWGGITYDAYRIFAVFFAYARYIRFNFYSASVTVNPSVFHVKVAEVMALQLL